MAKLVLKLTMINSDTEPLKKKISMCTHAQPPRTLQHVQNVFVKKAVVVILDMPEILAHTALVLEAASTPPHPPWELGLDLETSLLASVARSRADQIRSRSRICRKP